MTFVRTHIVSSDLILPTLLGSFQLSFDSILSWHAVMSTTSSSWEHFPLRRCYPDMFWISASHRAFWGRIIFLLCSLVDVPQRAQCLVYVPHTFMSLSFYLNVQLPDGHLHLNGPPGPHIQHSQNGGSYPVNQGDSESGNEDLWMDWQNL